MIGITFKPLAGWPPTHTRTKVHDHARFRAKIERTIRELERELRAAKGTRATIEIAFASEQIARDGIPYSGAVPKEPGVIFRFVREGVETVMPCDKWSTWESNLRAIALTLRNLREVERYGATQSGQQYRGFQALTAITTPAMSVENAAECALRISGKRLTPDLVKKVMDQATYARDVVRLALKRSHPETPETGNAGDFTAATEARRILQAKHGEDL